MATKRQFEAALARVSLSTRVEPRIELDGDCKYECFDDVDGNEVAFIAWQHGKATYHVMTNGCASRTIDTSVDQSLDEYERTLYIVERQSVDIGYVNAESPKEALEVARDPARSWNRGRSRFERNQISVQKA
jgi:hypothetical protein